MKQILLPEEPTSDMLYAARWALDKAKKGRQGIRFTPDEKHTIRWKAMVDAHVNGIKKGWP